MVKKKQIRIIVDGRDFTDVREDYRCNHPTKKIMARFRRIYSKDGDSIVMWDWME